MEQELSGEVEFKLFLMGLARKERKKIAWKKLLHVEDMIHTKDKKAEMQKLCLRNNELATLMDKKTSFRRV